jgi:hypothetical protein
MHHRPPSLPISKKFQFYFFPENPWQVDEICSIGSSVLFAYCGVQHNSRRPTNPRTGNTPLFQRISSSLLCCTPIGLDVQHLLYISFIHLIESHRGHLDSPMCLHMAVLIMGSCWSTLARAISGSCPVLPIRV